MKTHLGQEVTQHIMLVSRDAKKPTHATCSGTGFAGKALYRVRPTGDEADTPYQVPKNFVLFITDVEWYALVQNSPKGGARTVQLRIGVGGSIVLLSRSVTFNFEKDGFPGSSEQLTSGFQVERGAAICPAVRELGGTTGDADSLKNFSLVLRGYVVKKPTSKRKSN